MANHVSTFVHFMELNEAGKQKLRELYQRATGSPEEMEENVFDWQFNRMWIDGAVGSLTEEDVQQYNWMMHNIGAKWCYMEELEDDSFRLTSAWSVPVAGIEWLVEQLAAVDPGVVVEVNYEDEMPNFFGVMLYTKDGLYDSEEWDGEELLEMFNAEIPEAIDHWDAETEQGDDVWQDLWHENLYEITEKVQRNAMREFVQNLKGEE